MEAPDLEQWWHEPGPEKLHCLVCQQGFLQSPLVRTFRVVSTETHLDETITPSKTIKTHLNTKVLLFDRHLDCIDRAQVSVLAISHVWDPSVSITQQRTRHSPQDLDVRELVVEKPVHIFRGCEMSEEGYFEFWHDYFSVPQWTNVLKNQILLVIHDIFHRAHATIAYLDDVLPHHISLLHHGGTPDERLAGMTGICKAQWFKRMWTAMEFVRSKHIRMMTADYHLVRKSDDPLFLNKLYNVYNTEAQHFGGDIHRLEDHVGMGDGNLVPWCLGPLREIRSSAYANFGMGFALLSKRLCRESVDFLYALRGITKAPPKSLTGNIDFYSELLSIARDCLSEGDYSPLLLTPKLTTFDRRLEPSESYNFHDVWTWDFDDELKPPLHSDGLSLNAHSNGLSVKLESIGDVEFLIQPGWMDKWEHFELCVDMALTLTEDDVDSFVATLGPRLFGADIDAMSKHLRDNELLDEIKEVLKSNYRGRRFRQDWEAESLDLEGEKVLHWLAEAFLLTTVPEGLGQDHLDLLFAKWGTMHMGHDGNHLAIITCPTCCKTSLFRAALFMSRYDVRGARAWRIPGLQYRMSHPDGMAILEKDGRIVGRMIWATPACECRKTEVVELLMPEISDPSYYTKWGNSDPDSGSESGSESP